MQDLIKQIIEFSKAYDVFNGSELELNRIKKNICELYLKQKHAVGEAAVFSYIRTLFEDDLRTYIFVLSILYNCCKQGAILLEVYDVLLNNEFDLAYELSIRTQLITQGFVDGVEMDEIAFYKEKRRLNRKIAEQYEKLAALDRPYILPEKRNAKRLVIVTNQYINIQHAPTRIIKEIGTILEERLGIEVLLVIAGERYDDSETLRDWIEPFILKGRDKDGEIVIQDGDGDVGALNVNALPHNIDGVRNAMEQIYEFNPMCVWYIGSLTIFPELLKRYTTVMAMPCSKEIAISEAPILVRYLKAGEEVSKQYEELAKACGQKIIDIKIPYKPVAVRKVDIKALGIPAGKFNILLIGNRLDQEVVGPFLEMLRRLVEKYENIHLIFIGEFNQYRKRVQEEVFKDRTTYLGYRKNLLDVVEIGDLFLNPPRKGAAAGAVCAMNYGIPVITEDECDVASVVGNEFVCSDLEEMENLVGRYITDKAFYSEKSDAIKKIWEREQGISLEQEIEVLLRQLQMMME